MTTGTDATTGVNAFGQAVKSVRSVVMTNAIVGIVLGLIALFWPGPTLLVVAWLFGAAIVLAGLFRIAVGLSASQLPTGQRWLMAIPGVLMVIAGVLCIANPVGTLVFLAIFIGISWIFDGIHDLVAGFSGITTGPRWLAFVAGILSIVAGIVVFTLPGLAIATFVTWGAILLIIVSVLALCTLPPKTAGAPTNAAPKTAF